MSGRTVPETSNRQDWPRLVAQAINRNSNAISAISGGSNIVTSLVCGVNVSAGSAIAINRANGQAALGDATNKPLSFIIGLAATATASGFVVKLLTGPVTLADWTALTGAAALSPGLPYFLNTAGNLTSTVPSSPRCLTAVGIAVSTTTLDVNPEQPIQL